MRPCSARSGAGPARAWALTRYDGHTRLAAWQQRLPSTAQWLEEDVRQRSKGVLRPHGSAKRLPTCRAAGRGQLTDVGAGERLIGA